MKRTWNRGGAHLGYKSFSGAALSMDQHAFSRPGGSPDRPYRRVVVLEVPPSRRRRPRRNTPPSASWRSPSRQAPPPPFRSLCRLASRQLAPLAFKQNKTRLCLEVVKKRKITPLTEWRPHGSPKILFVTYQKPIKDDKRAKNFLRERLITSKMGFGGFRGGRKSVTRARGASEEGRGQASC